MVNEAFRKEFFPNSGNTVGALLDGDPGAKAKTSIVGVVANVRQDLHEQPLAELDWLIDALPTKPRLDYLGNMELVVRTNGGHPAALVPSLRNVLNQVDPTVPFQTPETLAQIVSEQLVLRKRPKFPSSAKPGLGPRLVSWTRQRYWYRNVVFADGVQLPRSVESLS